MRRHVMWVQLGLTVTIGAPALFGCGDASVKEDAVYAEAQGGTPLKFPVQIVLPQPDGRLQFENIKTRVEYIAPTDPRINPQSPVFDQSILDQFNTQQCRNVAFTCWESTNTCYGKERGFTSQVAMQQSQNSRANAVLNAHAAVVSSIMGYTKSVRPDVPGPPASALYSMASNQVNTAAQMAAAAAAELAQAQATPEEQQSCTNAQGDCMNAFAACQAHSARMSQWESVPNNGPVVPPQPRDNDNAMGKPVDRFRCAKPDGSPTVVKLTPFAPSNMVVFGSVTHGGTTDHGVCPVRTQGPSLSDMLGGASGYFGYPAPLATPVPLASVATASPAIGGDPFGLAQTSWWTMALPGWIGGLPFGYGNVFAYGPPWWADVAGWLPKDANGQPIYGDPNSIDNLMLPVYALGFGPPTVASDGELLPQCPNPAIPSDAQIASMPAEQHWYGMKTGAFRLLMQTGYDASRTGSFNVNDNVFNVGTNASGAFDDSDCSKYATDSNVTSVESQHPVGGSLVVEVHDEYTNATTW